MIELRGKEVFEKYFQEFSWDDYEFSENNGHVDHSGIQCKLCFTTWDEDDNWEFSTYIIHFKKEHAKDEGVKIKASKAMGKKKSKKK